MPPSVKLNTDSLLSDLGGCGKFQTLLVVVITVSAIPHYLGFFVDTFGIYNPGWKCLDNITSSLSTAVGNNTTESAINDIGIFNRTNLTEGASEDDKVYTEYGIHSCKAFDSCQQVEFSPDASTIVTEWGLTCNRGWILSTMLSIRMAGYLCSTLTVGYIGDRFGRRLPFVISRFVLILLNVVATLSVSWQMYAAVSFFMGIVGSYSLLVGIILNEFVAPNWRIKMSSLPTWSIVSCLFALLAMAISEWKTLRWISAMGTAFAFVPILLWMPESLRWVSINGKRENFMKLIGKVAKLNKAPLPRDDAIDSLIAKNRKENKSSYTIIHLFRKGYRLPSIIIACVCFSTDVIYFAFQFGVAALPGNFYINLIIFSLSDLPATFTAFFFANRFLRKPTMITTFGICAAAIFAIVAIDLLATGAIKEISTVVFVNVSKLFLYIGWIVLSTSMLELYPTVVRSTVGGYAWFTSSLGGIFAPYFIPSDPSTFYICYLAMAVLCTLCTVALCFFPETKGKPMKDTWGDGVDGDRDVGGKVKNGGSGHEDDDDDDGDTSVFGSALQLERRKGSIVP